MKNQHFLKMSKVVKHFCLIRSEHLIDDLTVMAKEHGLKMKHCSIELQNYQKQKKRNLLTDNDYKFIRKRLNNYYDQKYII